MTELSKWLAEDQDYLLLADGQFLAVHGTAHPPGYTVGELVFTPRAKGTKRLNGVLYDKTYSMNGNGLPETSRTTRRASTGTPFDNMHLFSTKSIIPDSEVRKKLPVLRAEEIHETDGPLSHYITQNINAFRRLFAPDTDVQIGLTGSLRLSLPGSDRDRLRELPHDVDLVITGSPDSIRRVIDATSKYLHQHPESRVFEYGKGWKIRVNLGTGLLCLFFREAAPPETLWSLASSVETVEVKRTICGVVTHAPRTAFVPQEIYVRPANPSGLSGGDRTELLVGISHLRSRGEFLEGDEVSLRGNIVDIHTPRGTHRVLAVVDGNSSNLISPPWRPF